VYAYYSTGTSRTATGQIVTGKINFVAVPTISCTPIPPKPSSSNGHNVVAVIPTSPAATTVPSSLYLLPLIQPHIYQHRCRLRLRMPNLFLHRALNLALPRLAGPPPRGVNMSWITIVITAVYLMMSHATITISSAQLLNSPLLQVYLFVVFATSLFRALGAGYFVNF
jgi:hypothetical protein